jgi:hypothetical protein
VTDVLLHRGDRDVFHKLAGNSGASFSENGFATLVKHSERDEQLAEKVGIRLDVPLRLFRELLLRATEAVRSRLMALAGPESREQIQRVLATIAEDAQHEAGFQNQHDYREAQAHALACEPPRAERSGDFRVCEGATTRTSWRRCAALRGAIAVARSMQNGVPRAVLVPCKAPRLRGRPFA